MKNTYAIKFKDVKIGEEFWDYIFEDQTGDAFIKTSETEAIPAGFSRLGKYIVNFKPEEIVEIFVP